VDGREFSKGLFSGFTAELTIGTARFKGLNLIKDSHRILIKRTADASGVIRFSGKGGTDEYFESATTSSNFGKLQACSAGDPSATGIPADDPAEPGPHAAGFCDSTLHGGLRIYYPAECGGLRRPPSEGTHPVVMILHGDGAVPLNYEYLGRHLATWGFISISSNQGVGEIQSAVKDGLEHPERFFSELAGRSLGGQTVLIGHSRGADRAAQVVRSSAPVRAVVLLGPVSDTDNYSLPGLVIGGTEDDQSAPSHYRYLFGRLNRPRYLAELTGANHSQFTDNRHWSSSSAMKRNRQFELVQSLTLAYLQQVFGQPELFSEWLSDPGLPSEISFTAELP
jgi:hypothetical protein